MRASFWDLVKCTFGHHSLQPSVNAKWDICIKCYKQFRVV